MPAELRKRKTPAASDPEPAPAAKKQKPVARVVEKVKKAAAAVAKPNGSASSGKAAVGETINLEGFGSVIETNDGAKTTLKELVDESEAGVVLFTYPAASTPGCKFFSISPVISIRDSVSCTPQSICIQSLWYNIYKAS